MARLDLALLDDTVLVDDEDVAAALVITKRNIGHEQRRLRLQGNAYAAFKTTSPATKIALLLELVSVLQKFEIPRFITNPIRAPMAPMPASKSAGKIEELPHHPLHFIVLSLASVLEDDLTALIDNVLRRPILLRVDVPRGGVWPRGSHQGWAATSFANARASPRGSSNSGSLAKFTAIRRASLGIVRGH